MRNFWHPGTLRSWVAQGWASECPDVKNYKWRLNPVWHGMLYSCSHMATVDVKGLTTLSPMPLLLVVDSIWLKQALLWHWLSRRCRAPLLRRNSGVWWTVLRRMLLWNMVPTILSAMNVAVDFPPRKPCVCFPAMRSDISSHHLCCQSLFITRAFND